MTPNEDPADPEFLTVEDVAARLKVRERPFATGSAAATWRLTRSGRNGASAATTSTDTSRSDG
jgi:hypothetical protein